MNLIKCVMIPALLLLAALPGKVQAQEEVPVRVISMNMRHGGALTGYEAQPFIDFINRHNPDFVVVQEMDLFTSRNGGKDLLTEIALGTKMQPYFGKSFDYRGGAFGVGVLSRYPICAAGRIVSKPDGVKEPRACGWIEAELPGGVKVRIGSIHLSVENDDARVENLRLYNDRLLKGKGTPTIIAGDFNAYPDSSVLEYAAKRWTNLSGDTHTFPCDAPDACIDYILGAPANAWKSREVSVIAEPTLSDHRFIIADLLCTAPAK